VKELMTDKITDSQFVNQVKIEFTSKSITAWGGLGVLIGKFLEKIEFRDWVEGHIPIEETSNNSGGIYEKVLSQFITVLGGGYRFSHLLLWGHGIEALQEVFSVEWFPKASTTLTRFWNKIDKQSLAEQLGDGCRGLAKHIINWEKLEEDNLNFDSTVMTRYGTQQGAERGYNPQKPGRRSHCPLLAFLGSGYVVNVWNRPGNVSSGQRAVDFFKQTVCSLGSTFKAKYVLGDSGFYLIDFIEHLESERYKYIMAVPMIEILQKKILRIQQWQQVDTGLEIAEFYFEHLDNKWIRPRRYVVVRQEESLRPQAGGKHPTLFKELEELKSYRFSLYITNDEEACPEEIWRAYRPRANDENVVKDLKEGYGFAAYNLKNFWATEAVMLMNALVFHNLIHYLNRNIINPNAALNQLKTLKLKYFIIPAVLGCAAKYSVLRLAITNEKMKEKIKSFLGQLDNMAFTLNCIAVDPKLAPD